MYHPGESARYFWVNLASLPHRVSMKEGGKGSLMESLPVVLGVVMTWLSSSRIWTYQPGAGLVQLPGFETKV